MLRNIVDTVLKARIVVGVIIGILLCTVVYYLFRWFMPVMWQSDKAKERLPDIIKEFGQPDYISKRQGGFAMWSESTLMSRGFPFYKIIILDEKIPHPKPKPHFDFLYFGYRIDIPDTILPKVLALSKSVWYDRLKKILWARCHFAGASVATIFEAIEIIEGKSQGTPTEYASAIFKTAPMMKLSYDPNAYNMYMNKLRSYRK